MFLIPFSNCDWTEVATHLVEKVDILELNYYIKLQPNLYEV